MTESMTLRQRATLVEALSSALTHGGAALGTIPAALRRLLEEDAWREFVTARGERVEHERFAAFVTMAPLAGLGADVGLVQRIAAEDKALADLLDKALQNPHGGDHSKSDNVTLAPTGNAEAKALRRLRKDAPELHADVLAERITAHAAMVQAGFRPKTVSIPVGRPDSIAQTLIRHMDADHLEQLAKLLAEHLGAADEQ